MAQVKPFLWGLEMNQLITSSANTMSSVDFREIVNAAREFSGEPKVRNDQFIARIEDELGEELGVCKSIAHPQSGAMMASYDLTTDQCLLVGMRESKAVRRSVMKALKDREPSAPKTFADALRLAADQQEQIEQQREQLAIAAPKVEFVDRYVESIGLKGFRQVAKLLGAKENALREFMVEQRIQYRLGGEWCAYQNHIDAGRFEVRTGTSQHSDHVFTGPKFTPKGVQWIAGLWAQHLVSLK